MQPYDLILTTLFLCLPLLLFVNKTNPPLVEVGLSILLSFNIVLSLLFWSNPIEHSECHVYDALLAKLSYLLFTTYILCIKQISIFLKLLFASILLVAFTLFYHGHVHSRENWCSSPHLFYHSIFHFCSGIGCSFAFM
jgi:hypothetical protein